MAKNNKVEISLEEKLKQTLVPVDEQPYTIPSNWVWTRLGNIVTLDNGEIIENEELDYFDVKTLRRNLDTDADAEKKTSGKIVEKNDLVILVDGENSGEVFKIPYRGYMGSTFKKLKFNTEEMWNYISMFLRRNKEVFKNNKVGSAIPHLNKKLFKEIEFPLPPLNEQKRIVENLDFLFEKTKRAKEIIEEVKVDIENRKISILDRAFKGILTSKWRNGNKTSDVKELLKTINDEKIKKWEEDCLQAEKDGNKKPKKPIIKEVKDMIVPADEQPYKLPDSWVWVRLENICSKITDGAHKTPKYTNSGVPFISVKDVYDNQISFDDTKFISQEEHNELYKRCNPEYDDILLTKSGTIGRTAVVKTRDEFSLFVSVALLKNYKNVINSNYLSLNIQDFFNKTNISQTIKGGVIKNYHISDMKEQLIPLPPLEEQQEIVRVLDEVLENENKVKELLELEERIEILEKSILHKAFKGELGTQNSSDESAIELLKEIL
ncbi:MULTISPECIES: restriction endonuclease subunit S [Fusobacterium]|jgi:putative type I restriction modification DNA specificity domain protein|uniref:restriction endonuclease subunit S n=1 Tax=Fusobacterium TaxID=848 RepID=UPI0028E6CDA8|nr:restriction endonuclease subunit S [Fusobacterium pseudoperiodonticum]